MGSPPGDLVLGRSGARAGAGSDAAAGGADARTRQPLDIEIVTAPEAIRTHLELLPTAANGTPFQHPAWIANWYATLGAQEGVEPLFVRVSLRETGSRVLDLPLIRRDGGVRSIAFADLGVTDYNAPLLGPAAPTTAAGARHMWKQIRKALPRADMIDFAKMPLQLGARANPLALLGAESMDDTGFSVSVPGDWDAYSRSLPKKFRKELGRSGRLLEKAGEASFRRIEDPVEARAVLGVLETQQRERLTGLGCDYVLDGDRYRAFYETVLPDGTRRSPGVLTVLTVDGEVVAALMGITDGAAYAMVRLAHAGGEWEKIGLGRLVIERTMRMLNAQGIHRIDFGIGDLPYKHGFRVEPYPLFTYVRPLSWRGLVPASLRHAKARAKRLLAQADRRRRRRRGGTAAGREQGREAGQSRLGR